MAETHEFVKTGNLNWWESPAEETAYTVWKALKTPEGVDYYYNTEDGSTSWDKPMELFTDAELANQGDWVWMPDPTECFVPATVKSRSPLVCRTQDGQEHALKAGTKLWPLKPYFLKSIVPDLVLLDDMSTPLILYNLKARFEKKEIYTNVGTILISANPYCDLGLYTGQMIAKYEKRGFDELPPHVFNIGHDAYKGLCDFKEPHSIIISGDSGAGKTEATKQVLSFISSTAGSVGGVEKMILRANPILEGFGNAKTVRNDNSSRFGKYMEVFFNNSNQIMACNTTNYLLEKIRVVQQGDGERNFHVFYQLVKACNSSQRAKYMLDTDPNSYKYLASSGCTTVDGVDDGMDHKDMTDAMSALHFSQSDQDSIFGMVACVLALGNIKFSGGSKASVGSDKYLETAAKLLQVDVARLKVAFTVREIRIRGMATTKVNLNEKDAGDTRHALAKFLYSKMFDWIVQKVNQAMGKGATKGLRIGILDIFGFEIFKHNSFEQLCINYTNEMLQQHFNNNTFKLEEQIYKQQKINFTHVDFIDNEPIVELITNKRPPGVLALLDEELVVPEGSDKSFLVKVLSNLSSNKYFGKTVKARDTFYVKHYAGQVDYDVNGFVEKNRDTIMLELVEVLATTSNPFVKTLFPADMSNSDRKRSLSSQFQLQLKDLMGELYKTVPHYIRCIKPNATKSASTFTTPMCLNQLTYSGVFEAVAIRKKGYPFRLKHEVFASHYSEVFGDKRKPSGVKEQCKEIIKIAQLNEKNVQMGTSMVLYRAEEHKSMELRKNMAKMSRELDEEMTLFLKTNPGSSNKLQQERWMENLSRKIEKADSFRSTTTVAEQARKLLKDWISSRVSDACKEADAICRTPYDRCDEQGIRNALNEVQQKGYITPFVNETSRLLGRIERINAEVNLVCNTLDEHHVEVCVKAGDEIGLFNQGIDYLRGLYNGPREAYLRAQYEKAVSNKTHDRAIRIDVLLKDIEMKRDEHMWSNLAKYPHMKTPEKWASKKLLGNKEQIRAEMLVWQKERIHTPLCHYNHLKPPNQPDKKRWKEMKKMAMDSEKYIMKYIGQRIAKRKTGVERATEAVDLGWKTPDLRDEIFIQLIKNITRNPDNTAANACWDLLSLCLMTFPPSDKMVNYLEYYLRHNAPSGQQKHQFVGWLRQRVYHGQVPSSPSLSELEQMNSTLEGRSRGFSEPLPPGMPSYADLLQSYSSGAVQANTNHFRREINFQGASRAAPVEVAAECEWSAQIDEASGDTYYYNHITSEAVWDMPSAMKHRRGASAMNAMNKRNQR